jgi:hypothetical protein
VGEGADDVPAVNDGQWHHFVAISDATGAAFGTALYVDGVRHGVNATKPVLTANAAHLMIGENPEARAREWEGEIDDIAIWSRVLTPAEISTLYNGGTGTPLSALQPTTEIVITSADVIGNSIAISWEGGVGPFLVQGAGAVTGPWIDLVTTTGRTTTQLMVIPTAFFRVIGNTTKSIQQFKAVLSGAAERPTPVVTTATGLASVSLDGDKVTTILSYDGLSGPPTNGHFHGPATADQAAGVMIGFPAGTLPSATSATLIFELTFDAAQKTALTSGMTYLNLHTVLNGGGEIRGQVVP